MSREKGRKDDTGKLQWDLLPVDAVEEIIKVLMYGAEKYGAENWQNVPNSRRRYFAAMMRHAWEWFTGQRCNDEESGLNHLAHAGCCLLFLLWFDCRKREADNATDNA